MFKEAKELLKLQQQAKAAQKKLKKEIVEVKTTVMIGEQEYDFTFSIKADMSDATISLNEKKQDKMSKAAATAIEEAQKKAANMMKEDMLGGMGDMGKMGEMMKKMAT